MRPGFVVPLLVLHGGEDALAYASGAAGARGARRPACARSRSYHGLFHEVHHEPEQAQVFADVLAWIEQIAP